MPRPTKFSDSVNVVKSVKTSGIWRFVSVVTEEGEIVRDHVWIDGRDEHHPEGRYFLDWYENGKRRRRTVCEFADVAAAARAKRRELIAAKALANTVIDPNEVEQPRVTLTLGIESYLRFVKIHRNHNTFVNYQVTLSALLQRCHRTYLDDVNRNDLIDFVSFFYEQGLAGRTVYHKLVVVLQMLKWHGRRGLIEPSDWPEYVETIRPVYEPEELKLLFQHAKKEERLLLKFFLASGFRDREVRYLTWRDVDFNNSVVRVTAKPACGFIPKNWEERVVPLPFSLMRELQALRESRGALSAQLVFPSSRGNRNKGYINVVKRLAERADLNCGHCTTKFGNKCAEGPYCRHFFLHKFRHTFATEYLRCGVDIRSLQLWMGHRDIHSTMVYLKGLESRDALIKVNASSLAAFVS